MDEQIYLFSFEKLRAWKMGMVLVDFVYQITAGFPVSEKYGLSAQMQRAAVSVVSNLAEGNSRISAKEKAYFTSLAYGSLMELVTQEEIAFRREFLSETDHQLFREHIRKTSVLVAKLRKAQLLL